MAYDKPILQLKYVKALNDTEISIIDIYIDSFQFYNEIIFLKVDTKNFLIPFSIS